MPSCWGGSPAWPPTGAPPGETPQEETPTSPSSSSSFFFLFLPLPPLLSLTGCRQFLRDVIPCYGMFYCSRHEFQMAQNLSNRNMTTGWANIHDTIVHILAQVYLMHDIPQQMTTSRKRGKIPLGSTLRYGPAPPLQTTPPLLFFIQTHSSKLASSHLLVKPQPTSLGSTMFSGVQVFCSEVQSEFRL